MTGVRIVGVLVALGAAVVGLAVTLGAWGVGYCGSLTPDHPAPGTLRSDLCRGTSGDFVGGGIVAIWALSVAAPLVGTYLTVRTRNMWPLVAAAAVSAGLLGAIAILAAALPG